MFCQQFPNSTFKLYQWACICKRVSFLLVFPLVYVQLVNSSRVLCNYSGVHIAWAQNRDTLSLPQEWHTWGLWACWMGGMNMRRLTSQNMRRLTSQNQNRNTEEFVKVFNSLYACILGKERFTHTSLTYSCSSGETMHGLPADAREDHIWIIRLVHINNSPSTLSLKFHPFLSTIK